MKCRYCKEEFDEQLDSERCPSCGHNPLVPNYKEISYKISDLKKAAKSIVYTDFVNRKMIIGLFYLLPLIVIESIIVSVIPIQSQMNILGGGLLLGIVIALLTSNLFLKAIEATNTGKAKGALVFLWQVFVYLVVIGIIDTVIHDLFRILIPSLSFNIGLTMNLILILLDIAVGLITLGISSIFLFCLYVYITRKVSLQGSIKIGLTLGVKNIGRFILLDLSFIPLVILIGFTLGILFIWKGFYMEVTSTVLMEKILQDSNLELKSNY